MTTEMYAYRELPLQSYSNVLYSKNLIQNLLHLAQSARRLPTHIPQELIQYVEQTRNPDIYTREFVELVMRYNQQQKGRTEAYASFRDILADQMMVGIPDIKDDVKKVLQASGGQLE
jgi:mediator of RNA polymerase II transcription subunit 10